MKILVFLLNRTFLQLFTVSNLVIGVTVKGLTTLASLQRDMSNHILSPQAIYKYGNENIEGIYLYLIRKFYFDEKHS